MKTVIELQDHTFFAEDLKSVIFHAQYLIGDPDGSTRPFRVSYLVNGSTHSVEFPSDEEGARKLHKMLTDVMKQHHREEFSGDDSSA